MMEGMRSLHYYRIDIYKKIKIEGIFVRMIEIKIAMDVKFNSIKYLDRDDIIRETQYDNERNDSTGH